MSPWALRAWRTLTGRRAMRWYRRSRWHRDPGWIARTYRKAPLPDVILLAHGDRDLPMAAWQVEGPTTNYSLDLKGTMGARLVHDFPAAGFLDAAGQVPHWDGLPAGRYWAVLLAWNEDERVSICKVPFRIYDGESKFWHWYEGVFTRMWVRWFGGPTPEAPQPP